MEIYGTFRQVDSQFVADARLQDDLWNTIVQNGKRYKFQILWADGAQQLVLSTSSIKVLGPAAYERPVFEKKFIRYNKRRLREHTDVDQICPQGEILLGPRMLTTAPSPC